MLKRFKIIPIKTLPSIFHIIFQTALNSGQINLETYYFRHSLFDKKFKIKLKICNGLYYNSIMVG